jgi:proliferating cell nuclear antigen
LTTDGFRQSLEDVALVSDHVRVETDGENMAMNAKGDIMGASIELKKGSDALLSVEVTEPSKSTFPLSYLSEIVKAAVATSDIVTLEFSNDMPVRLDFKQTYDGTLVYYLAPRIEVE